MIVGVDPDPANNPRLMQWAKDYWLALHPLSSGGGYVNMMMDEGEDNVKAAYRDNYARLAQVKAKYDPQQPLPGEPEHQAGLTGRSAARGPKQPAPLPPTGGARAAYNSRHG